MKFEEKFSDVQSNEKVVCEEDIVLMKSKGLGVCSVCGCITRWIDLNSKSNICSEECLGGNRKKSSLTPSGFLSVCSSEIKEELEIMKNAKNSTKDIIVIVHDQLDYTKACIKSIRENTSNYKIYIWDNASQKETSDYLQSLLKDGDVELTRSSTNLGFIEPNNELASWGDGEYIILLNSDCEVYKGWWEALLGFLQTHPETAEVGCMGGLLEENGIGIGIGFGYDIDYLSGWCVAFSRETYNGFGLFNKQLRFAYAEDSDFSLRLKEAGKKIYAIYTPLSYHHGNSTVNKVNKERTDLAELTHHNHEYIRLRWKDYLAFDRVNVRKPIG